MLEDVISSLVRDLLEQDERFDNFSEEELNDFATEISSGIVDDTGFNNELNAVMLEYIDSAIN